MAYRTTGVLEKAKTYYDLDYHSANSILVPQLSAIAANMILKYNLPVNKSSILRGLIEYENASINKHRIVPVCQHQVECPCVLIAYNKESPLHNNFSISKVKNYFEANGYSCAVVSDSFSTSDFSYGQYRLHKENLYAEYEYYRKATTDDIVIFYLAADMCANLPSDLKMAIDTSDPYLVYSKIIEYFS